MISLPEQAPQALLADKGYDADAIRNDLASRNIEPVIPGRANRHVKIEYDRTLYKQRNLIKPMFGRLKINRAIATRAYFKMDYLNGARSSGFNRLSLMNRQELAIKTIVQREPWRGLFTDDELKRTSQRLR